MYTPLESINIPDVDPIRTEKIQTLEFGYKGFLGNRTHFSLDYYLSYYEDFFSPPTIITPFVVERIIDDNGNDITNIDLINRLQSTGKSVIVSTGLSSEKEINTFVQHIKYDNNFKLINTLFNGNSSFRFRVFLGARRKIF